jgi:pyruvate dehydrogenase E2 component (dihydrolipoamide acetyltransferase)
MAQIIGLPKLSPTMEEGVLVRWTKKEGDKVSPGDLIAEVETDKANMDFNIEDEGVLLKFLVKEGDTVKLGAPVMILGKAGEDVTALAASAASGTAPAPAPAPTPERTAPTTKPPPVEAKDGKPTSQPIAKPPAVTAPPTEKPQSAKPVTAPEGARVLASPLAKSLAIELGIDLRTVTGTGPGGRIVERDVKAASDGTGRAEAPDKSAPKQAPDEDDIDARTTQAIAIRQPKQMLPETDAEFTDVTASRTCARRIAKRLAAPMAEARHPALLPAAIQIDAARAARAPKRTLQRDLLEWNAKKDEKPRKISYNDLVMQALAALALRQACPQVQRRRGSAPGHPSSSAASTSAVAVALARRPRHAGHPRRRSDRHRLDRSPIVTKDLAERAKHKGLKGHEITGSTFTISNLGMFGIERFTAILNPPEAGILAVGAVMDVPVVKDGQVVAGKRMTVSMSCDHRVIDGALGAKWLQAFAELIEKPESLAL